MVRGLQALAMVTACAIAVEACGADQVTVRPSTSTGGRTVAVDLKLISADPQSSHIVLAITTGGCEQSNADISVDETDDTIKIVGTTLKQIPPPASSDASSVPVLNGCLDIGFMQQRFVDLRTPIGNRHILLNGVTATYFSR